jgi:folate-binding protein YgfZ
MATVRYVNLERGLVSVTGTDRQSFLQGLISQDVDRISTTRAAYGAFLTPQGKYLHDFCLAEIGERLILDGEQGRADELIGRITRFKLRAQVDLAVGDPGAARPLAGGIAFVDPRSAELGCRLILPAADSAAVTADLAIDEAPFEAYDTLRIGLGIPDGRRDMDVEKSSLLECNFDALNGIDWEKGCYIGQEVTARTKYRGLVKRQLMPVHVDGAAPAPGTAISVNGKQIGEIRSIHDGLALASLRLDALGGADDRRPLTAGGAVISLILPQSRD